VDEWITIAEYARRKNQTQEAARQKIRRGTLQSFKGDNGRTLVLWSEEEDGIPQQASGSSRELVEALRSQITSLEQDKEQMREEAHRMQQIIMALSQKIPEPPQESFVLKELTGATQEVKEKTVRGITKWMRRFSR
jgi:hypothetical protein